MADQDFTTTIVVDQTPAEVFAAVNDVRSWWSGDIDGPTDRLGREFRYRHGDQHRCTFRVSALVPGERVAWYVVDNRFSFTADRTEWTGNTLSFDIAEVDGRTELRFTQHGLVPAYECYEVCSNAWEFFVGESLKGLIAEGEGQPIERTGPPVEQDGVPGVPAASPMPRVVEQAEWQKARDELLEAEKAATRALDELAARRRALPMAPIDREYSFATPDGPRSLPELFDGRDQLITYQFMDSGPGRRCPGCTWFTDNIPATAPALLAEHGITWVTISDMPLERLDALWDGMGWTLPRASSHGTTFSRDTGAGGGFMLSVFLRDGDRVHRTYSTTSRGLDRNAFVTGMLDLTAYGRREQWEDSPRGWPQQPTFYNPSAMPEGARAVSFGRFR
ncbi:MULTISPECIES: DUF899 family protein [Actinosynnema]|uniref:DUF899 family protein n=1 Tax=Actinosynnema TaxID=40566 RepID=UPI0020A5B1C1|nr:DUF899 family protein [Actinosynnema pretiosum]MCP2094952.1 putative dithiol-disulfide oxidoreductase, DUF899 family [Actinosynnema pretiosum]